MVMARGLAAPEKLQNRGVLVGWEVEPGRCNRPLGGTVRPRAPGRKLGGRSVVWLAMGRRGGGAQEPHF